MQQIKFTAKSDEGIKPAGPMCSLDMKPKAGSTIASTGAVSSAFLGFLI